jgi:xanthosine utilization system XapX-like protein
VTGNPTTITTAPPRGSRLKHVVFAALIFIGGAACGASVATLVIGRAIHRVLEHPEEATAHFAARLANYLDLDAQQTEQVRRIIQRHQAALAQFRHEIQPRLEGELTQLEEEIAAVLNDSQKTKWHAHAASVRANWLPPAPPAELKK